MGAIICILLIFAMIAAFVAVVAETLGFKRKRRR